MILNRTKIILRHSVHYTSLIMDSVRLKQVNQCYVDPCMLMKKVVGKVYEIYGKTI